MNTNGLILNREEINKCFFIINKHRGQYSGYKLHFLSLIQQILQRILTHQENEVISIALYEVNELKSLLTVAIDYVFDSYQDDELSNSLWSLSKKIIIFEEII